jgi:acyl-CoA reductase-like NAD-dependent aldehyde dehydrogenase
VVEKHYDRFVEAAAALTSAYKLGNPLEMETTLGPVANKRFAGEVRAIRDETIRAGAKPLIDPKLFPQDDGGAYLMPQILVNVNHQMRLMREEAFGPVVGIMKVKGDDEAADLMNDSQFGLTASLWTADTARAENIGQRLETGTVFQNRCDYLDPGLCWTGVKDTGKGGSMSVIGFHNLTRPKSWHLKKVAQ